MQKHALMVGVFAIGLYLLCLVLPVTMTDPEVIKHHMLSLKTLFPGFQGYDVVSIVWGAAMSFGYGVFGSLAYHSLHAQCCIGGMKKK